MVLLQEEIRDLLVLDAQAGQSVHIREVPGGGICLAGATEKEVGSKTQMAELLSQGTLQRATASTNMNKHSSRSHAIFTITVEQRRQLPTSIPKKEVNDEVSGLCKQLPHRSRELTIGRRAQQLLLEDYSQKSSMLGIKSHVCSAGGR